MPLEIERKFLVADDSWRASCVGEERLVDGLLATSSGRKVRVRIYGGRATLAIETKKIGGARHEFEYEIPLADARHLIASECGGDVITKTRRHVPYRGFNWEIDIYEGALAGVVVAEVELASPQDDPPLPPWIGCEVTEDPAYRKSALRARVRVRRAPSGSAEPREATGRELEQLRPPRFLAVVDNGNDLG